MSQRFKLTPATPACHIGILGQVSAVLFPIQFLANVLRKVAEASLSTLGIYVGDPDAISGS